MPDSFTVYKAWKTEFSDRLSKAEVARELAKRWGLSENGLRGTLTKCDTIDNKIKLSEHYLNIDENDPSVTTQQKIISASETAFQDKQYELEQLNRAAVGIFISDKHNPSYRKDVWRLLIDILSDLPICDYISVFNDWNDYKGWSLRWEDTRRAGERLWTEEIEYADRLEQNDYGTLKMACPDATLLGVMGNHDMWIYKFYRTKVPNASENSIAQRMAKLHDAGVLQFSRGKQENAVQLSPGLIWLHGKYAAKTSVSNARNTMSLFSDNGMSHSIVYGHTHRGSVVHGHQLGIRNIKIVNNHCLCKTEGIDYLPLGKSNLWTHGFTICYFYPTKKFVDIETVDFQEYEGDLVARVNGKTYSVPVDKS